MSTRDLILRRVKDALAPLPKRAAYPSYSDEVASLPMIPDIPLRTVFKERLQLVGGVFHDDPAALGEMLEAGGHRHGYCDPVLLPMIQAAFPPSIGFSTRIDPADIDACAFGITRASGGIAETGTIILRDQDTASRLGALAPWIHIAVLEEKTLMGSVSEGLSVLGHDPNTVWCTGPSKTADVEGILIQGVHGPGVQVALLIPSQKSP